MDHRADAGARRDIRPMSRAEVQIALDWAADEGWNPGLRDAEAFYAADPEGFLLAEVAGRPVGCISAVRYGEGFAFLGLYIVKPQERGKGYGMALWREAMRRVEGRVVGLDGVVAQQANYRRLGFEWAYGNARYEGMGLSAAAVGAGFWPIGQVPLEMIMEYDAPIFGAERQGFLEQWLRQSGAGWAVMHGQRLVGYGKIRPCRRGWKIGPLFADAAEVAEGLLDALLGAAAGEAVFFDVPLVNAAAVEMAERRGMKRVFETARMYRGGMPKVDVERVFGVTTFELG